MCELPKKVKNLQTMYTVKLNKAYIDFLQFLGELSKKVKNLQKKVKVQYLPNKAYRDFLQFFTFLCSSLNFDQFSLVIYGHGKLQTYRTRLLNVDSILKKLEISQKLMP